MPGREQGPIRVRNSWTRDIDYDIDDKGVLIYESLWNQVAHLEPGQPISDPHVVVAKVGMQTLNPTHFSFRESDLTETVLTDNYGEQIGDPLPPGLSVFMYWGSRSSQQHDIASLTENHMGRVPRSRDKVYITQVADIIAAGWTAYFAPVINAKYRRLSPLRVLLVPGSIERDRSVSDASLAEREALAKAFIPMS